MSKKLAFISIPITIVPYLALFTLATIFFSTVSPFFGFIMESVFCSNLWYLVAALFIYCIAVFALTCICFFVSINKNRDALAVAKTAMIIKLAQVPAYILIFALGVMFFITIFTIPFSIGLFIFDCLAVFMTGLLVISSVVISVKNQELILKDVIWILLLQFVFCGDVIASVFLYRKLKKIHNQKQSLNSNFAPPNANCTP